MLEIQSRLPASLRSPSFRLFFLMARENTTQGISFHPDLLARTKARAKEKGLSISAYVQQLIRADLSPDETRLDAPTLQRIREYLAELVELRQAGAGRKLDRTSG